MMFGTFLIKLDDFFCQLAASAPWQCSTNSASCFHAGHTTALELSRAAVLLDVKLRVFVLIRKKY